MSTRRPVPIKARLLSERRPAPRAPSPSPVVVDPDLSRLHKFNAIRDAIPGWMHGGAEIVWDVFLAYQRECGEQGHFLELGVFHGLSAALMALHADPQREELVLVDQRLRADAVRRALRLAEWDPDKQTHLLETATRELGQHRLPRSASRFRWIHIDAEHTAHAVRRELALSHRLLTPGGIVVVDDFFGHHYPQVTAAVYGYLAQHPTHFRLFASGFGKAYLVRRQCEARWFEFCEQRLPAELAARGLQSTVWKTSEEIESSYGIRYREANDGATRGHDE